MCVTTLHNINFISLHLLIVILLQLLYKLNCYAQNSWLNLNEYSLMTTTLRNYKVTCFRNRNKQNHLEMFLIFQEQYLTTYIRWNHSLFWLELLNNSVAVWFFDRISDRKTWKATSPSSSGLEFWSKFRGKANGFSYRFKIEVVDVHWYNNAV